MNNNRHDIRNDGHIDMMADIKEFHEKFRLNYDGPPRELDPDLAVFRHRFMKEELDEYAEAYAIQDLAGRLDALVDLAYVLFGTAYMHGFDFEEGWRRVHEANMKKIRALTADDSKRGSHYDVVKPPGWKPANLEDLV